MALVAPASVMKRQFPELVGAEWLLAESRLAPVPWVVAPVHPTGRAGDSVFFSGMALSGENDPCEHSQRNFGDGNISIGPQGQIAGRAAFRLHMHQPRTVASRYIRSKISRISAHNACLVKGLLMKPAPSISSW